MRRWLWLLVLLLSIVTLVASGCKLVQQYKALLWSPLTPAVVQGQVRDAITKLPVAGARLQAGPVSVLSDVRGTFSITALGEDVLSITAPGYEEIQVQPRSGVPLVVDLVPDASTTFSLICAYEMRHEFGREYDLLHPDVQALFSRDEFIRYMEQCRPYDIVDCSVGAADVIASGIVLGKVYSNVAQVPVRATVRVEGQMTQRAWLGYAVKVDGLWRWFRGPLLWSALSPTATVSWPVVTSTPWPTSTATSTPAATSTPQLTRTPTLTATASPTAYYSLLVPGGQAVVVVGAAPLHAQPGAYHPVTWSITQGTVVLVLEGAYWLEGLPWYRVQTIDLAHDGWCNGIYLMPLVITATPTQPPSTAVPPSTQCIAFTTERDGNREVYVMNSDGTELRNLTQHPAQDGDPTWSPMHDWLAFTSDRNNNNDIFLMSDVGTNLVQLTFSTADEIHPAWSPDGALIAYVSNEDGDWEIFVMSANGTGAVQLTHNEAWDSYPSWSPDGHKLVFTSDRDGNYELYLYDLETRTETRLTNNPASDAFPAWSPVSEEIAFTSARDGRLELYLLDLAATPYRITRLTDTMPADVANRYPTWSSDGQWLAFTSWRDGNAEIYVMHRDGWGLHNLTNNPALDECPAWAD